MFSEYVSCPKLDPDLYSRHGESGGAGSRDRESETLGLVRLVLSEGEIKMLSNKWLCVSRQGTMIDWAITELNEGKPLCNVHKDAAQRIRISLIKYRWINGPPQIMISHNINMMHNPWIMNIELQYIDSQFHSTHCVSGVTSYDIWNISQGVIGGCVPE